LSAYGLSDNATKLLLSYLSNRKQQIKIGNIVSTWANIQKGVPQASILGSLLFGQKYYQKNLTIKQIELFPKFSNV
jgi:hypothetical protein